MKNKAIVFDLLNNDNGEEQAILAAKEFAFKNPNFTLILVGNQKNIIDIFNNNLPTNIQIINSENLVKINGSLREVLRQNSSMLDAFNSMKNNNYDALISSGDSASFITMSSILVERIQNIDRPAFMPTIPTVNPDKNLLLLDVGANLEVKPEYLVQWAKLAQKFYVNLYNSSNIKIGLLNIGTEEYKGTDIHKNADLLLKENMPNNYVGFVEPQDLVGGNVDIVVSDGYAGNIFLKTLESSFMNFGAMLKAMIMKNLRTKLGGLHLKKELKQFKERFDYRNIGGAFIIGVNKVVVKAHGRSDKKAFLGALNQVKLVLDNDLINSLEEK